MSSRPDRSPVSPDPFSHEQVAFCHDPATGLRAIIALYSTALGPGSRRDAVLPVCVRRRRARRRPRPLPGDGVQERGRRPRPRGRQGGHHRRPPPGQDPRAPARIRPLRGEPERPVRHRLPTSAPTSPTWTSCRRRRGSRPAARRRTAGRATRRCSPRTASSKVCVRRPSTGGDRRACPGGGSASPGSARWARRLVELLRGDGASVVVCDVSEDAVAAVLAEHPSVEVVADAETLTGLRSTCTHRTPWVTRWTTPRSSGLRAEIVCGAANNQLGVEGAGRFGRPARRARDHLRARLRGQQRRRHPGGGRARRVRLRARAGPDGRDLRPTLAVLRESAERGTTPVGGREPPRRGADGGGVTGRSLAPRRWAGPPRARLGRNLTRWGSVIPTKTTIPGTAPRRPRHALPSRHE